MKLVMIKKEVRNHKSIISFNSQSSKKTNLTYTLQTKKERNQKRILVKKLKLKTPKKLRIIQEYQIRVDLREVMNHLNTKANKHKLEPKSISLEQLKWPGPTINRVKGGGALLELPPIRILGMKSEIYRQLKLQKLWVAA